MLIPFDAFPAESGKSLPQLLHANTGIDVVEAHTRESQRKESERYYLTYQRSMTLGFPVWPTPA